MYSQAEKEQIGKFYTARGLTWNVENNILSTPGHSSPTPPARETCMHYEALFKDEKLVRIKYGTIVPKHILPIAYDILDLDKGLAKICEEE